MFEVQPQNIKEQLQLTKRRSRNSHGTKTMIQAITDALAVEMENDKEILVFGEDVGKNGGFSVQQKVYKKIRRRSCLRYPSC